MSAVMSRDVGSRCESSVMDVGSCNYDAHGRLPDPDWHLAKAPGGDSYATCLFRRPQNMPNACDSLASPAILLPRSRSARLKRPGATTSRGSHPQEEVPT